MNEGIKTYVKQQPKIGEIFHVEGRTGLFQCVENDDGSCEGCVDNGLPDIECLGNNVVLCEFPKRDDGKDVIFVKVKYRY